MEEVEIRSTKGRAKLLGALVCISGALLFTFWKGHPLKGLAKQPLIAVQSKGSSHGSRHYKDDWIKGSFLILISQVAFSAWLILQVSLLLHWDGNHGENIVIFGYMVQKTLHHMCAHTHTAWNMVHWSGNFGSYSLLQAKVYEVYPARLTTNTWICFFASLQSSVLALIFERKTYSWKLDWDIQLLTIIYSVWLSSQFYRTT